MRHDFSNVLRFSNYNKYKIKIINSIDNFQALEYSRFSVLSIFTQEI